MDQNVSLQIAWKHKGLKIEISSKFGTLIEKIENLRPNMKHDINLGSFI